MRKPEQKSRRIFLQFFITYLVLVSAVVWPFYPLFNRTLSAVKESSIINRYKALENGFMDINSKIVRYNQIAYVLSTDSDFSALRRISGNMESQDYYKLIRVYNNLKNMAYESDVIHDYGIMFINNEFIISKQAIHADYTFMYPGMLKFQEMDFEQWKAYLFESKEPINLKAARSVVFGESDTDSGKLTEVISGVIPLPMIGATNKDSILYFLIDSKRMIERLISNDIIEQGFIYILDKNDNFILRHNYHGDALQIQDKPVYEKNLDGMGNTTLMHIESEDTGLKVVVGVPDSIFNRKIHSEMQLLTIYLLSAVLIGIIMSLLFAYRQSKPIQNVINTISGIIGRKEKKNTYEYIKDVFLEISQTNEAYRQQISIMESSIKISLTQKILNEGPGNIKEKHDFMNYYNVEDTYYCVVVMDTIPTEADENPENMQKVHVAVAEYTRQRISHKKIIYNMDRGKMALVINLPEDEQSHLKDLGDIFRQIAEEITGKSRIQLSFRISAIGTGIENIHQCYKQAKNIYNFYDQENWDPVSFYTSSNRAVVPVTFDTATAQKLHDLILMGELEGVSKIFDIMYQHIKKYTISSESDVQQTFYSIRNVLDAVARVIMKDDDDIEPPGDSVIQGLSMKEALEMLEASAVRMCIRMGDRKRSRNARLKQDILNYVADNYANPDLCVTAVAEHFKLSEKYLYNLVKEQTGKSFGEYLEGIRFRQAEKLLIESDTKINRIHKMIGFYSQNTFYKAFYRIYGVSPGTWREHNKQSIKT